MPRSRPSLVWWIVPLVVALAVTPVLVGVIPTTPAGFLLAILGPAVLTDVVARVLRAPPATPEAFGLLAALVGCVAFALQANVQ